VNRDLVFGDGGFLGLSHDLSVNLVSELIGLVLSIFLISIALEHYRDWREASKWRASRKRIAADIQERHEESAAKFAESLAVFGETHRRLGGGLFQRLERALETTTRYYERNVFFLPPKSLAHFENYRLEFKRFVALLKELVVSFEFDETPSPRVLKKLAETDFARFETHLSKFCRSLGRRHTIETNASFAASLEALLALPDADLRHILGTPAV